MITTVGLVLLIVVVILIKYVWPQIPALLERVLYAVVLIVFVLWLLAITGLFRVSLP